MKTWYTCKVKSIREGEDGSLKQVTDAYLVDAVSYTEAESRIHDLIGKETPGEFSVSNISKTNISEVINFEDVDTWFKCKISYATVDADTEKEVKINTYYLVSAAHAKEAYERVEDSLSSMLVPFDIPSVTLTNILEVFPYMKEEAESIPDNLTPVSKFEGDVAGFEASSSEGAGTEEDIGTEEGTKIETEEDSATLSINETSDNEEDIENTDKDIG